MPIKVLMPALSPTMTEGTITTWIKSEGEQVSSGEVLCEIETDKATMEVEAVEDGTLEKIIIPGGTEDIAVNTVIAIILEDGEDPSTLELLDLDAPPVIEKEQIPSSDSAPAPRLTESIGSPDAVDVNRTFASPLAKRLAAKNAIDLNSIRGSGPRGRVIKRDVQEFLVNRTDEITQTATSLASEPNLTAAPKSVSEALPRLPKPEFDTLPNSSMRKVIAARLTESARDIPHFNISIDVEADELLRVRDQLNCSDGLEEKITINDLLIKSVALALILQPDCNVTFMDEAILRFKRADIAIAVAIDGGLITPIIHNASGKGLRTISQQTKELARRAQEGKLAPEEYQGGTFTISNLGMFKVKSFNSIINSPQGGILSVGAAEQRAIVKDGSLGIATVISLTLAFDHRCIDGVTAAAFASELKGILENPMRLIL